WRHWIDTYFLFKKDLKNLNVEDETMESFDYHFIDINSIGHKHFKSLLTLWAQAYKTTEFSAERELRNLFQDGDICHALIYADNVVGMFWSGQKTAIMRLDFANLLQNENGAWLG